MACVVGIAAMTCEAAPKTIAYLCEGGGKLVVTYEVGERRDMAKVEYGKRRWWMTQMAVASGARYVDGPGKMEWWSKGPEGFLTDLKTQKTIPCKETIQPR